MRVVEIRNALVAVGRWPVTHCLWMRSVVCCIGIVVGWEFEPLSFDWQQMLGKMSHER